MFLYMETIILRLSMGCGCSTSIRKINPSTDDLCPENTPQTVWKSFGSKHNGVARVRVLKVGSGDSATAVSHCGVDTASLNGDNRNGWNVRTRNNVALTRISAAIQCDRVSGIDAAVNTVTAWAEPPRLRQIGGGLVSEERRSRWNRSRSYQCLTHCGNRGSAKRSRGAVTASMSSPNIYEDASMSEIADFASFQHWRSDSARLPQNCLTLLKIAAADSLLPLAILTKSDAAVQTEVRHLVEESQDEIPEFAPRPPASRKIQLLQDCDFRNVDLQALHVSNNVWNIRLLTRHLTEGMQSDLDCVRAFYVWIARNIRYDVRYADLKMSANDILEERGGVAKHYCQLFAEMCRLRKIRVKLIRGFAKGFDFMAGHNFREDSKDGYHCWNVVFINGFWRLIDCTWGTGFTNSMGRFQERFNEHYFLTDPDVFIWSHFPYDENVEDNCKWQLIEVPISLKEFNSRPKVTSYFFDYNVKVCRPASDECVSPFAFHRSTEVILTSPEVLRYKYKLYPVDEVESNRMNRYVFCQLKGFDRSTGSFLVNPPEQGDYYLKIFAYPEKDLQPESILNCIIVFRLRCERACPNVPGFPISEYPWGLTGLFHEFGLKMVNNMASPVVVIVSGRKALILEKTLDDDVILSHKLYDAAGNEVRDKSAVIKFDGKEYKNQVRLLVQPPDVGLYKLSLYACPRPTRTNREGQQPWCLPRVATFLVDCKQSLWTAGQLRQEMAIAKKMRQKKLQAQ